MSDSRNSAGGCKNSLFALAAGLWKEAVLLTACVSKQPAVSSFLSKPQCHLDCLVLD